MPHRSLAHSALVIAPSRLENKEINVLRSAVLLRVGRVPLSHHVVCSCITALTQQKCLRVKSGGCMLLLNETIMTSICHDIWCTILTKLKRKSTFTRTVI